MNRNPTKTIWIHSPGVEITWLMPERIDVAAPGHVASGLFFATAREPDERDQPGEEDADPEEEAPGPGAAAVDDVLLAQPRLLGAEQARPGDQTADDEVDEAAEADHDAGGRAERGPDAESDLVVEPEVRGRARQERDDRRDAGQPAQLGGERHRLLARAQCAADLDHRHVVEECSRGLRRSPSPMDDSLDFSHAEVRRSASYHRPLYLALLADLTLGAAVLAALAWAWPGRTLFGLVDSLPPAAAAAAYAALVVCVSTLVRLPLAGWRGWLRERRWGFSTQSFGGWVGDGRRGLRSRSPSRRGRGRRRSRWRGRCRRGGRFRPGRPSRSRCCSSRSWRPSCSSRCSTASRRSRTRTSRTSCARSRSGRACRYGMCSSPMRAAARRS